MEKSNLEKLYTKFLNNNLTSAEFEALLLYFNTADEAKLNTLISLELFMDGQLDAPTLAEQGKLQSILKSIKDTTNQGQSTFMIKRLYKIAIAAAILIICSLGIIFYKPSKFTAHDTLVKSDIPPGTNQAILTLANGQKIVLSSVKNGRLATSTSASIAKTADGKLLYSDGHTKNEVPMYNILATPRGGQHFVQLSDGTKVWLNAASILKFPESFNGQKQREIFLSGEAYFEVAKMHIPFIVKTIKQNVEVLGTHFNVNAYEDEQATQTTLLEGSVKIILPLLQKTVGHQAALYAQDLLLKPGEQAITVGNKTEITNADLRAAIGWKNGDFTFKKGEDFRMGMRKLERWYNVEMVYDSSVSTKIDLGGWLSRKLTLSAVLERISSTEKVHFKIEGRRVVVTK